MRRKIMAATTHVSLESITIVFLVMSLGSLIFELPAELGSHISRFLTLPRAGRSTIEPHFPLFIGRSTTRSRGLYAKKLPLWPRPRSSRTVSKFISAALLENLAKSVPCIRQRRLISAMTWEQGLSVVDGRLTGPEKLWIGVHRP